MADKITKLSTFCLCGHPMQQVSRKSPYVDAAAKECSRYGCANHGSAEAELDRAETSSGQQDCDRSESSEEEEGL